MFRLLKALPLALAMAAVGALGLIAAGCGAGGSTQVRMVNALANNGTPYVGLDVYNNLAKINSTALGYAGVYPPQQTTAQYVGIPSGSGAIEVFNTGTTTNPIFNNVTEKFSGNTEYTLLLAGSVNNTINPPTAFLFTDYDTNGTPPKTGNVEFRLLNGSASSTQQYSGGIDIYILPPPGQPNGNPTISGLTFGSDGPGYLTLPYLSSTGYNVFVTPHNNTTQLFSHYYSPANQQVTTLVITDNTFGSAIAPTLIYFDDLD